LTAESIKRFDIRWGGDVGKYRYRVILPIRTVEGKLLAYAGRAIKDGMVPKTKKNRSPHRTFFGLYELIQKFGKVPVLIITEGEFDAIYLQQFGIPAISNMGTMPICPEKLLLLRRYTRKTVLNYDSDEAGGVAMYGNVEKKKRGEVELLSRHMPTSSIELPEDCDPNNLSEKEVIEIYGKYMYKGIANV
jgi:DNA primase